MVQVVVGRGVAAEVAARARTRGLVEVEVVGVDEQGRGTGMAEAEVALRWNISDDGLDRLLEACPGLRWIHSPSAGEEGWPMPQLQQRGITLTNAAGVFAVPIAEWVMAAVLHLAKRMAHVQEAQRDHRWVDDLRVDELSGATMLLIGAGGIGREIARRATCFGMRVLAGSRSGSPVPGAELVVAGGAWRELLPEADYVVVVLPLTADTRGALGKQELARMKPGAALINVGRGATVDEPVLLAALESGALSGAAIDAWTGEPLPASHPAWRTPGLFVSPHTSGSSPHNERRGLDLFLDNLGRFVRGEGLRNVVDLNLGY